MLQEQEYSSQMYPVGGLVYYISPPTSLTEVRLMVAHTPVPVNRRHYITYIEWPPAQSASSSSTLYLQAAKFCRLRSPCTAH